MNFAAVLFWWQNRHRLKARGYSWPSFRTLTNAYWTSLLEGGTLSQNKSAPEMFSRRQIRARW